jgi:Transcription factor Tfb2
MKLLSANQVELATLISTDTESQTKFKRSEDILIKKLGIVDKFHKELNGPLYYQLNPMFKESLLKFLSNGLECIF